MKKTKQRILFSTLLAATLLFASLGLSTLFMNKRVSADEETIIKYEKNIEDVVNTYNFRDADIVFGLSGEAFDYSTGFNTAGKSTNQYDWALYTDAATKDTTTSEMASANKYKGNLSGSTQFGNYPGFDIKVPRNTVITYRFTFRADIELRFAMNRTVDSLTKGSFQDGYVAILKAYDNGNPSYNRNRIALFIQKYQTESATSLTTEISSTNGSFWSQTNGQMIKDGDEAIVTYGVYSKVVNGETTRYATFSLKKSDGTVVISKETPVPKSGTTTYEKDPESEYVYMGLTCYKRSSLQSTYVTKVENGATVEDTEASTARTSLATTAYFNVSIAGINRPIAQDVYNTTVSDQTFYEGDSAATTVTLPSGYALVDNNATLAAGENNLAATYTINDYYGKVATVNCTVKVTAQDTNKVTLKNSKGTVIDTEYLKQSESNYTLINADKDSGLADENTFVGWFDNENNLYPAGYTMTITDDTELTLAEISFTLDGAYLRVAENGGMRYIAQLASDPKTEILNKSKWYGVILPKDRITSDIASAISDTDKVELTNDNIKVDADGQSNGYFALTNILVFNYSRTFTATSYLEVSYDNDTTGKIFTETKDRSVIEIAYAAYNSSDVSEDVKAFVKETYLEKVVFITENEGTIAAAENITISIGGTSTSVNVVKKDGFSLSYTDSMLKISGLTYSASADGNVHIPIIKVESDGSFVEMLNSATEQDGGYVVTFNN